MKRLGGWEEMAWWGGKERLRGKKKKYEGGERKENKIRNERKKGRMVGLEWKRDAREKKLEAKLCNKLTFLTRNSNAFSRVERTHVRKVLHLFLSSSYAAILSLCFTNLYSKNITKYNDAPLLEFNKEFLTKLIISMPYHVLWKDTIETKISKLSGSLLYLFILSMKHARIFYPNIQPSISSLFSGENGEGKEGRLDLYPRRVAP